MTLQGLRVRDALGIGEGSTIPSRFLGSCKGRGLWLQVTSAEELCLGSSSCGGGSRCGQLWEGSWTGGGQPPAERASLASALPGCSISQQCCCLHTLHSRHPSSLGICFSLWEGMVEADGLQHSLSLGRKREPLLLRQKSSACDGAQNTKSPKHPSQPGLALEVHQRVSPVSVLPHSAPRVPSFPADPPFPSPAFP